MSRVHSGQGAVIPTELVEWLEVAEAGDRQCDSLIDRALNLRPPWAARDTTPLTCWEDGRVTMGKNGAGWDAPQYTTSLDAALALAERLDLDVLAVTNEAVEALAVSGWSSSLRTLVPELARHACIAILKATAASAVGTKDEVRSEPNPTETGRMEP